MIKIFDDVVSTQYQNVIEESVFSPDFSWHYNPSLTTESKDSHNYGFFHTLIRMNLPSQKPDFLWLNLFSPLVYESASKAGIKINQIFAGRAFLQIPSTSKKEHDLFHIDFPHPHFVFLYYVNDSDGDTIITRKKCEGFSGDQTFAEISEDLILDKVSPKKGRMVVFDGTLFHAAGIPQQQKRVVLNFDVTGTLI